MTKKEVALVTGPTSGIGCALAKILAHEGYDLVLVGRDKDKLKELKHEVEERFHVFAWTIHVDLAQSEAAQKVYDDCEDRKIEVDILVNNAGLGSWGPFENSDHEKNAEMIHVNTQALTELTRLFLPRMLEKKYGRILNVASVAGFFPGPLMAVYYATKAYVLSFSQALRQELSGTGVTVTTLCPGATATQFGHKSGMDKSKLFANGGMEISAVAAAGFEGMIAGKNIVIPGIKNKLFVWAERFIPRYFVTKIVMFVQDKK